jgi:ligand-binding sensor domain-containing protein
LYFDGEDLWIGSDKGLVRMKINNALASWNENKEIKPKEIIKNRKKKIIP